jgi:hypothetical protein
MYECLEGHKMHRDGVQKECSSPYFFSLTERERKRERERGREKASFKSDTVDTKKSSSSYVFSY